MPKRRTRRQKIRSQKKPLYPFGSLKTGAYEEQDTPVKSYFIEEKLHGTEKKIARNNTVYTEQYLNMKLIKNGLIKSLLVSSFMLCLIVVLYFIRYRS